MSRTNCFFYAFKRWLSKFEGYIAFRISLHFPGIHWFYVTPDRKTWCQYTPKHPKNTTFRAAIHKLWYEGEELKQQFDEADKSYALYLSLIEYYKHIHPNASNTKAHRFARKELIAFEDAAYNS